MNRDQLAVRLRATFLAELEEQVGAMNAETLALESDPGNADRLRALFRIAHTLKGAAHAAGVPLVEQACHTLETLLASARDGNTTLGPADFALLFAAADALADAGNRLKSGKDLEDSPLGRLGLLPGKSAPRRGSATSSVPDTAPQGEPSEGLIRVQGDKLDALLMASADLLVAGDRATNRAGEVRDLHASLSRMSEEWRRHSRGVRVSLERGGAPVAASHAIQSLDTQLHQLIQDAGRIASRATEDARLFTQATTDIADRVRRLRMRPFADACEALPRAVRDLATTAGKEVRLELSGSDLEADRVVLDGLRESVLHLVRNAVDHGLESPKARERAGKPRQGVVTVAAALKGDRVAVTVSDDGAGLDVAAIRSTLERRGQPIPGDGNVGRALLEGGFSTRTDVTMVSGRGVGLDLVRDAVRKIRGTVDVTWVEGEGTTFTLECPPTLATIRALLVAVGPQIIAIPTNHVDRLLRLKPEQIRQAEGRAVIPADPAPIPLVSLARLLPPLVERPLATALSVVVLQAGEHRMAVVVDDLLAEQEIVLRPVGAKHTPLPHLIGAALLSSGKVALVLNTPAVITTGLSAGGVRDPIIESTKTTTTRRRILVVDDSITTRTLEQSILEAAGYDVVTGVDGVDGWRLLQEARVDLVVSDVEMPRMDGFGLCATIRGSKRLKDLPVILVTALDAPEHRARGLEVGADAYLGKASFDQQNLLDTIRQLLG